MPASGPLSPQQAGPPRAEMRDIAGLARRFLFGTGAAPLIPGQDLLRRRRPVVRACGQSRRRPLPQHADQSRPGLSEAGAIM